MEKITSQKKSTKIETIIFRKPSQMTSRQRVRMALEHKEADRVPIDLGGFQTGIHKKAYAGLLEYLGLKEKIVTLDPVQQLAKPSEEILKRFHIDTRYVCAGNPESFDFKIVQNQRDGKLWHDFKDEFGVVWSMPDDQQLYMDISYHPLANASIDDLDKYPWPQGGDPTRFKFLRDETLRLHKYTRYAICTGISGVIYEYSWYLRGLEQWYMDMLRNPEFCEALLDHILQYWMDFHTGFMGEIGDLVDVIMIGDDLAGQLGPLFSPKFYRDIVKPRQKKLTQHIKSMTKAKIWYHTCGNCIEYIPDLKDNGVDIINPVQISASNMDADFLKKKFGREMIFWGGGCDSQHILPFASSDEVRLHVKKNISSFKPNGGYVFNNVHNIQAGVPAENIVAMFDAAYEYGSYL